MLKSAEAQPLAEWRTPHGTARVVGSIGEIDPVLWSAMFAGQCKDARYYEVVAQTVRGKFDHRYLILTRDTAGAARPPARHPERSEAQRNGVEGPREKSGEPLVVPRGPSTSLRSARDDRAFEAEQVVQPMFLVDQDVLAGLPQRFRRIAAAIRRRFPRFCMLKMLMVGSVVGESHLASSEPWAVEALRDALEIYGKRSGAAVVLLKDFPATYRETLQTFKGYQRAPSMPGAELALIYDSFEHYMQRKLGKVFRKNLRRKFRKLGSNPKITMEVASDVTPWADEVFRLYRQTYDRSEFQFEELTADYFKALGQQMPDRVRFFLWRQSGRLIAVSVCMVHNQTLYDLEMGLDYTVALDLHLYYMTWRDIVQWAIDHNLKRYHTGPLNYDPKLHLRLALSPLDLYAKHTSPLFNPIFGLAMKYLQPARHHRILSQFPNADEL